MKRWIYERFLPMWAKETLLKDYRQLRRENARLRRTLREREAYIKGLHRGLRGERIPRDLLSVCLPPASMEILDSLRGAPRNDKENAK